MDIVYRFKTEKFGEVIGDRAKVELEAVESATFRASEAMKDRAREIKNKRTSNTLNPWFFYQMIMNAALGHNLSKIETLDSSDRASW